MKALLRLGVVAALVVASALAIDFGALRPQGYVSDFAGVIDARSRLELERYCKRVEQATGAQVALVTLDTLGGEPVDDVANLLFRRWSVGQKGKNEGILLLMVTRDRKSRLEVGYGLEPILPDGFSGSLLREMSPALRQRHYGEAMLAAAQTIGSRIAAAKGVQIGTEPVRRRYRKEQPAPWWLLLGGAVALIWLLGIGGRRGGGPGGLLSGLILGSLMGRSMGSGSGGGGFGGFDSGDSFGGFGGGDSGGGGASSDW
jgi:uncharacterized protein